MGLDNPIHIAFLLILLLLVFGAKRLPELGRSLGSGMRGFKESLSGESAETPPLPRQLESTVASTGSTPTAERAPAVASTAPAPTAVPAAAAEPEAPFAA